MENTVDADQFKRYLAGDCTKEEEMRVENWLLTSPANAAQASQWIEAFSGEEESLFLEVLGAQPDVWEKTKEQLNQPQQADFDKPLLVPEQAQATATRRLTGSRLKVAAALGGILLLAFAAQLYKRYQWITVETAYGQVRSVTLPDQSVVHLNGNSKLRYKHNWQGQMREVWLDGEAFFKVTHLKNNQKFLVRMSDRLSIEVLGTEFNASDRTAGSRVVLKSGKIKLSIREEAGEKNIYVKPGDLVEIDTRAHQPDAIRQATVNPQMYYAWTDGKWLLDGTSLGEMLQKLEETYGVKTVVKNKALLERRASGSIPVPEENAETMIADIANLFELEVYTEEGLVHLNSTYKPGEER